MTAAMQRMADQVSAAVQSAGDTAGDVAKDSFADAGDQAGDSFAEAFGAGVNLAVAAFAADFVDKIIQSIDQVKDYAGTLNILHLESGNSMEQLQSFQYALASVGVEANRAQMMFSVFQSRLQAAVAANNG